MCRADLEECRKRKKKKEKRQDTAFVTSSWVSTLGFEKCNSIFHISPPPGIQNKKKKEKKYESGALDGFFSSSVRNQNFSDKAVVKVSPLIRLT